MSSQVSLPKLNLAASKSSRSVSHTSRVGGGEQPASTANAYGGSQTARRPGESVRDLLFGAEPWRGMVDEHKALRRRERTEALEELAEYRRKHPPTLAGSAADPRSPAGSPLRHKRQQSTTFDPPALRPGAVVPRYARPQERSMGGRLPALALAREGIEPPPVTPTPTDFELLSTTKGAVERKKKKQQRRQQQQSGSPVPDSPSSGIARSPRGGGPAGAFGASNATKKKTTLAPLGSPAVTSPAPKDLDRLAFTSPGKYIAAKISLMRNDPSTYHTFRSEVEALEEDQHRVRAERARLLAPALEASRVPVDHDEVNTREEERRRQAKAAHRQVMADAAARRREIVDRDEAKQERSIRIRDAVQNDKPRCRNWLLVCSLVRSVAGFLLARQAGYRERWIRLLVVYGVRHWRRRTLARRETFAGLRLNFFIRRNLPNMVEAFRLRRCQRAAPLLHRFFDMYSYAMTFTVAVRTFMKQVKRAQGFVRHRRTVRTVMLASLRAAWDRECDKMRSEDALLIEVPAKLRDVLLWKLYLAESVAFGKLRHHILSEWRSLRNIHIDLIKMRLKGMGKEARHDPILNAMAHADAAYSELNRGAAKEAFVDRQFSSARNYLDGDISSVNPAASTEEDDTIPFNADEAYLMGDWFHARHHTGGRHDADATPRSNNTETDDERSKRKTHRTLQFLGAADQMLQLKNHHAAQKKGAGASAAAAAAATEGGAGAVPAQLHPSMRFGQNKDVAYGDEGKNATSTAVKASPAGTSSVASAQSPAQSHLPGATTATIGKGGGGVKAAVASSQSRLGRTSSLHQHAMQAAAAGSPATTALSGKHPTTSGRRKSMTVAFDSSFGGAAGGSAAPRAAWEVPRTKDGIVDEEYLIHRPKMPKRKLLTRPAVMNALIRQARDAIYAGMRRQREEKAAAAAAMHELMADVFDDAEETESGGVTPRSGTPQATAGHKVPASSALKPGQLKKNQSNADAFVVQEEFNTHDAAYLARYIDFSWLTGFVTRVSPGYGPHGTVPPGHQLVTKVPGSEIGPTPGPTPQYVALGLVPAQPQLARAASFKRRESFGAL